MARNLLILAAAAMLAAAAHSEPVSPVAPVGISATALVNDSAILYWGAVPGVRGYKVYRDGQFYDSSPNNIYRLTTLSQGVEYHFGASAVGDDGESPVTGNVTFTAGADIGIPAPALTKGAQGSTGFSTQDLKDSGRTSVVLWADAVACGSTGTETAITLSRVTGTADATTGTSFAPTAGKTFRITSMLFSSRGNPVSTLQSTTFSFRVDNSGPVTTSSNPVFRARSATIATSGDWDRVPVSIPDGLEIPGDGTAEFGVTASATYVLNGPTWDVLIIGFEY